MCDLACSVLIDAPVSFGAFEGGQVSAYYQKKQLVVSYGFQFTAYIVLPGNDEGHPTAFSAVVDISPSVMSFSAAMYVPGVDTTRIPDDETQPAWPNAFGLTGLDIYDLGFSAGILPAGLPGEVGFTATMSLYSGDLRYVLGFSGMTSANPGRVLIRVVAVNVNQCFHWVLLKVMLSKTGAGAFGPSDDLFTLCMAFSWMRFDLLKVYYSTGANIGGIDYPAGGQLEAHVSLFGKWPVADVVGQVDMASYTASLNGTLHGFDLGPVVVSGYKREDVTFGFEVSAFTKSAFLSAGLRLWGLEVGVSIAIAMGSFDFDFQLQLIPEFSLWVSAHASVPVPPISPDDPVGAANALLTFDPSQAQFAVSAGVDASELVRLMVDSVRKCKDILDDVLAFAQKGFNEAKKAANKAANAATAAANKAAQAVMSAARQLDAVKASAGRITDKAKRAVAMAENGVSAAGDAAARLTQKAEIVAQKGVNAANRALDNTRRTWNRAIARAEKSIEDALRSVERFAREIADTIDRLSSWTPWEHRHEMHTMARSQFEYEIRERARRERQQSAALSWNGFREITPQQLQELAAHVAAAEQRLRESDQSSRSLTPADRHLLNFLDDMLDGLYYMKEQAERMVKHTAATATGSEHNPANRYRACML